MEFMPLLVFAGLLVKKIVDFVRYAKARDVWGAATQLLAWAGGIGAIILAAHTAWAATTEVLGVKLGATGLADQIWLGLQAGSLASVLNDVTAAIDRARSSAVPRLDAPPVTAPAEPPNQPPPTPAT